LGKKLKNAGIIEKKSGRKNRRKKSPKAVGHLVFWEVLLFFSGGW
jgi:hypothetical protein